LLSWVRNERYLTTFLRLLSPGPNERILDVGAGKGVVAELVQRTGSSEVHALDPSEKRIEFMQRERPNLRTCLSSADSIPYPDGTFDKAYSTLSVHHFNDKQTSFRELARVLRPGGTLVIVDISPKTLVGRINRWWENGIRREHLVFLDLDELVGLLKQEGRFEVRETKAGGPGYFVQALKTA
jgi:ubiquinone/menaquinone biosynthesis C-methylase UbiE